MKIPIIFWNNCSNNSHLEIIWWSARCDDLFIFFFREIHWTFRALNGHGSLIFCNKMCILFSYNVNTHHSAIIRTNFVAWLHFVFFFFWDKMFIIRLSTLCRRQICNCRYIMLKVLWWIIGMRPFCDTPTWVCV